MKKTTWKGLVCLVCHNKTNVSTYIYNCHIDKIVPHSMRTLCSVCNNIAGCVLELARDRCITACDSSNHWYRMNSTCSNHSSSHILYRTTHDFGLFAVKPPKREHLQENRFCTNAILKLAIRLLCLIRYLKGDFDLKAEVWS